MLVENKVWAATWGSIEPGTLIVAIDGIRVEGEPWVVEESHEKGLLIADDGRFKSQVTVYRDNHDTVTIQDDQPWRPDVRTVKAMRRNPRYWALLAEVVDGPLQNVSRGDGVCLAMMKNEYGLVERGPRRTWVITEQGETLLALKGSL